VIIELFLQFGHVSLDLQCGPYLGIRMKRIVNSTAMTGIAINIMSTMITNSKAAVYLLTFIPNLDRRKRL